jgi:hypothetical protein
MTVKIQQLSFSKLYFLNASRTCSVPHRLYFFCGSSLQIMAVWFLTTSTLYISCIIGEYCQHSSERVSLLQSREGGAE